MGRRAWYWITIGIVVAAAALAFQLWLNAGGVEGISDERSGALGTATVVLVLLLALLLLGGMVSALVRLARRRRR